MHLASATRIGDFPLAPMIAIVSCLLAQNVANTSLSTYMGVYVEQLLRLRSSSVAGYYTSWLQISFTLGGLMSCYTWGMFADRFGRKPVMIIGVSATGVFAITFGLSTNFGVAMISRFLFGLANYIVPIARIMIVELLGPERSVIGIAFIPGSRAAASICGPIIGGLLAKPAEVYPSTFSSTGLFGRFPFLLPNLAVALLAFASLLFTVVYLPETVNVERGDARGDENMLEGRSGDIDPTGLAEDDTVDSTLDGVRKCVMLVNSPDITKDPPECISRNLYTDSRLPGEEATHSTAVLLSSSSASVNEGPSKLDSGLELEQNIQSSLLHQGGHRRQISTYSGEDDGDNGPLEHRRPDDATNGSEVPLCGPGGLLRPSRVRLLVLLQFLVAAVNMGFFQTYPLWLLAGKETGGLGWPVSKIGKVLGWAGVGMMLFQFSGYPALVRTVGIVRLLRGSGVFCALLFLAAPEVQRSTPGEEASYVVGVVAVVLIGACLSVVESALNLASANAVAVRMRGKFGGVVAIAFTLGRMIGPSALNCLLAWSLHGTTTKGRGNNGFVDYHAVFAVEMVLIVVITLLGRKALTLESLTLPIENRPSVLEYEAIPQLIGHARTPRSSINSSVAEATKTARGIEAGQRRRDAPVDVI